jgi:methionyl-tRNA formyltransferase
MINRVLVFGNDIGLPQSLRHLPRNVVCGIVAAEIRSQGHKTLQTLALQLNLPFIIQPRASSPAYPVFVEKVRQINPDLIFVNSYSMLLHSEILSIPRFGAVNVHAALLPQFRGPNPYQWAILNEETESGVTMHYMDEHFDTGDIIAQRRVPIYFNDTWHDIHERIYLITDKMFEEEIPKLLAGKNNRQPQDENRAKKWPRRHPEDGLISWQESARHIYNLVRALVKPLPGAFYRDASGKRVVLDEYLTIPQIMAIKYGEEGGQKLETAAVRLMLSDSTNLLSNDCVNFSIYLPGDNKLIGSCQLININNERRIAELEITLDNAFRNIAVYQLDVAHLMLQVAFKDLQLHHVFLNVLNKDTQAIQLYIKAGFKKENFVHEEIVTLGIQKEDYA